jgi:methionine sulfoxide reductase heme-binding subunit
MTTNLTPHLFWVTSRAAGFASLILASLAVSLGLLMSTRLLKGRGADLRVTHEILSLSAMVALVVHAVSLLGDKYLHPSVADIALPFASSYKTPWMTLGIISGWAMLLLGLSYYARRAIGSNRWRKAHRFTAVAWLGGLGHSLGMGTDAGQLWFLAMIGIVVIPALLLLATRVGRSAAGTPARAGAGTPAPAAAPRTAVPARTVPEAASVAVTGRATPPARPARLLTAERPAGLLTAERPARLLTPEHPARRASAERSRRGPTSPQGA